MPFQIHLKQFDGPLDLLLTLIGSAKIEPKDIFVSEVTAQYIEIVQNAPDFDMDDASDFLRMAALLVEIKSRNILPRPPKEEEEEDPEALLIARLEEYRRFKETALQLRELEAEAEKCFGKLPEELGPMKPRLEWDGLTLQGLWNALLEVEKRLPRDPQENVPRPRRIRRDLFSVEECMEIIQGKLRFEGVSFQELFSDCPSREEAVTLFLALLELLRLGVLHIQQAAPLARIMLWPGPAPQLPEEEEEFPGKKGRRKKALAASSEKPEKMERKESEDGQDAADGSH